MFGFPFSPSSQVYVYQYDQHVFKFVTDGGSNMIKAVEKDEAAVCIAHTLGRLATGLLEDDGVHHPLTSLLLNISARLHFVW